MYSGSIKGKVLQRKAVGHAMQFLCKLPRFKKQNIIIHSQAFKEIDYRATWTAE